MATQARAIVLHVPRGRQSNPGEDCGSHYPDQAGRRSIERRQPSVIMPSMPQPEDGARGEGGSKVYRLTAQGTAMGLNFYFHKITFGIPDKWADQRYRKTSTS